MRRKRLLLTSISISSSLSRLPNRQGAPPPPPSSFSAAMSLSSFAWEYRSLPSLSRTKVDRAPAGDVEKKGINQRSPTRTLNVAPTVIAFAFPFPPTQIQPAPAKVVQEARQVAHRPCESSRQSLHDLIDKTFSTSALRPTTHAPIGLLASAPPPLPSV